jgi:TRAP-type C4-dicarboxylate transport system permease small subunit
MDWIDGTRAILAAAAEGDAWMLSQAFREPAAWVLGLAATVLGGLAVAMLYRKAPWLDRHLEPAVMVTAYLLIGGIIFVEVIRRFAFGVQAPWSTTLPPFLFLVMAWVGCSWNVRLRTHLAFGELRNALPRTGQMLCLTLDAVLWVGFSWVVVVTSTRVTLNSAANFQIMLGTDDVMQWWFLALVPVAFVLIAARAIENLGQDWARYRSEAPLIEAAVIGAD